MKRFGFYLSTLALAGAASAQDSLAPLTVVGDQVEEIEGLSAEELAIFQTQKVKQLLGQVPGFASTASDSAGFGDFLGVRGTGNVAFFGPAGVAMTVDGVPYGDAYTYSTDFFDLESAQLHRGPQGAFFGRNGAGGLLELKTPGPTADPYLRLTTEYGNYDAFGARVLASGPINDKFAYTFQAYYNEREGYIDNNVLGTDVDSRERFGALARIYYRPSADLEVSFRAMFETARDGGQRLSLIPGQVSPFGVLGVDPFQTNSNVLGSTSLDRYQLSLHVKRELGWATFQSISSFQKWSLGPNFTDLDFSNPLAPPINPAFGPFVGQSTSDIQQDQDYMTNNFMLESDQTADFRWRAGLFRSKTETDGTATRVIPFLGTQTTTFDSQRETYALYGSVAKDLNSRLTLEAGGRIEYVDTELNRSKGGVGFSGQTDDWYFSPTLGLSYEASDDVTLFARTSIGVKPAGFTAFSDIPATSSYEEETSWETEIGLRYEDSVNDWDLELRAYYKKIDDYQLNRSVPPTDFIILNADEVRAIGIEAEANWNPSDSLSISASAGLSEIEFEKFGALSGNRVPFVPEFTAALGFRYDFGEGFYVSSAYRAIGSVHYEDNGNPASKQETYQILDAQIGYEAENWSASIFGHNLLDENYYSYISPQISAGAPGTPALYGVRVSVEF
ncbi:TonB-dependent receptor [Akkermansiaceae bacterium]|nr:TonB-dependent receptor [Akkermansiaceae bacterium]